MQKRYEAPECEVYEWEANDVIRPAAIKRSLTISTTIYGGPTNEKKQYLIDVSWGICLFAVCRRIVRGGGRFISASAATESGLSMSAGASIRLNEPSGVKFQAVLPAAEYRAEDNYGFLIVPNDYFSKAGVVLGETTDYVKAFTKAYEEGKITKAPTVVENLTAQTRGELCYFEHSIVGILEQNYDREWFGVAFKKTGEGGTAEYAYAGFSDNIRSVQEVSSRALNKLVYHAEDLEKILLKNLHC